MNSMSRPSVLLNSKAGTPQLVLYWKKQVSPGVMVRFTTNLSPVLFSSMVLLGPHVLALKGQAYFAYTELL